VEAAIDLVKKYDLTHEQHTDWIDGLENTLKNLEDLEKARAKEAWEKHVVSV